MNYLMFKVILCFMFFVLVILYPVKETVTIDSSCITSIKPFAGTVNGYVVGTDLCVTYWLNRDLVQGPITYEINKPFIMSILGYVYSVKIIS